jgi:RNA polymerase primary sigma factor
MAAALEIAPSELRAVGRPALSLDEAFGEDEEQPWVRVVQGEEADPGDQVDRHLLKERVEEVLRGLAPRDREVIEMRFGLRDGRQHTLEEVAQRLGVTRERVRQLELRGLARLREPGRRRLLAGFTVGGRD